MKIMPINQMCSVKELATLYYVDVLPEVASRNLRRDIREYPDLHRSLIESGWNSRKRTFTPRQVQILRKFLGDPM
ncbi:DUF4248 domain-containing protein [Porphyromonas sp.]|uniref:DUF4248 domain-containing protein n=1 Tax=Porphyromonas sp. TaxID=1924944 RepID=UPI0026DCB687|nr:DUF4248 domain-containing protein [Porphyromonas sp.]MDO4770420.1 DUF4248 domain-containing protein [Porphyromonas sp.]